MAVTLLSGATTTTTPTSEQTLLNVQVAGVFSWHVDLSAMAAGDFIICRIYQVILTATTPKVVTSKGFDDVQIEEVIKIGDTLSNDLVGETGLRYTIQQSAGSARAIPWKVLQHA